MRHLLVAVAILLAAPSVAEAHPGGLNACGCHVESATNRCHCHDVRDSCNCDCYPVRCDDEVGCGCQSPGSAPETFALVLVSMLLIPTRRARAR
jgi:MYXO-CTERM domain-containing protein